MVLKNHRKNHSHIEIDRACVAAGAWIGSRNAAAALEKLWRTYSEVRIETPKWTEKSESQRQAEGDAA